MATVSDAVEKEFFNEIMNSAKYVLDLVEKDELKETHSINRVRKAYKNNLCYAWTKEKDIEFSENGDTTNVVQMITPDDCCAYLLLAWGQNRFVADEAGYNKDYTIEIVKRCLIQWKREEIIEKRRKTKIQNEYIQFLDEGWRGQFSAKAFTEKYGYPYQTTRIDILKEENFVNRMNEEREPTNILPASIERKDFREWLKNNHLTEKECWTIVETGNPRKNKNLWKIDAIEEAICFGWMPAEQKVLDNGVKYQRWCPRKKDAFWSELDKARAKNLINLGLMTDAGEAVLPNLELDIFDIPWKIKHEMRISGVLDTFMSLPPLYQRVSIDKILEKEKDQEQYENRIEKLINSLKDNKPLKEKDTWNDYGRLASSIAN